MCLLQLQVFSMYQRGQGVVLYILCLYLTKGVHKGDQTIDVLDYYAFGTLDFI